MGGLFGVASKEDCVQDLFFGTDYHSHLGTSRGAMVVLGRQGFTRSIHNIESTPFRSKFEDDILEMEGPRAIRELEGREDVPLEECAETGSERFRAMVERIRQRLPLTSLRYQTIPNMIGAIGLPKERVCICCWDGVG
jgi:hypothetical protein